jgi:uncharacterized membrane protein
MIDIDNPVMAAIVLVLLIIGIALIKIFWAMFTGILDFVFGENGGLLFLVLFVLFSASIYYGGN